MWLGAIKRGRDRLQLLSPSPGITSGRFLTAVKPPGDVCVPPPKNAFYRAAGDVRARSWRFIISFHVFFLTGYHVIGATRVPRRL